MGFYTSQEDSRSYFFLHWQMVNSILILHSFFMVVVKLQLTVTGCQL